jgi:hypothetical protein
VVAETKTRSHRYGANHGLAPRIAQMQKVLAPVRDAMGTVGNAVSLLNSMPMMADRAPRLAALDETFNRLEGLGTSAIQVSARTMNREALIVAITQDADTTIVLCNLEAA